jgi:hypothetical protein
MEKLTKNLPLIGAVIAVIAVTVLLIMGYQPCKLTVLGMEFPLDCETEPVTEVACPPGAKCYSDNFDDLNTARWCKIPDSGIRLKDGQLLVTASPDTAVELHPCEYLDHGLTFVELTLQIVQSDGQPGSARAGLGTSLNDDGYIFFELDSAGNAVLSHGLGGQSSTVDEKIPGFKVNAPHTLRVEWQNDQINFFVDGTKLSTELTTRKNGNWFLVDVNAWPEANITADLINVNWGVLQP